MSDLKLVFVMMADFLAIWFMQADCDAKSLTATY